MVNVPLEKVPDRSLKARLVAAGFETAQYLDTLYVARSPGASAAIAGFEIALGRKLAKAALIDRLTGKSWIEIPGGVSVNLDKEPLTPAPESGTREPHEGKPRCA